MHVPMEPSSQTSTARRSYCGKRARGTSQQPAQLDRFDGYVGINNHMGSRFTAHLPSMQVVMSELDRRGLAFLDSVTSGQSQGRKAAIAAGVDFAIRNIFIDHQNDVVIINQQLAKIEALARKQGHAIAIGHPRERTLQAMAPWLKGLEKKRISVVPVSPCCNRQIRAAAKIRVVTGKGLGFLRRGPGLGPCSPSPRIHIQDYCRRPRHTQPERTAFGP